MSPVPLTYVGIHDEVGVPLPDEDRRIVCKRGETKDFPDDLAGRAPSGDPGDEDYDPGEGLLAQTVNWQPAGDAKKTTAKKRAKKATLPPPDNTPRQDQQPSDTEPVDDDSGQQLPVVDGAVDGQPGQES